MSRNEGDGDGGVGAVLTISEGDIICLRAADRRLLHADALSYECDFVAEEDLDHDRIDECLWRVAPALTFVRLASLEQQVSASRGRAFHRRPRADDSTTQSPASKPQRSDFGTKHLLSLWNKRLQNKSRPSLAPSLARALSHLSYIIGGTAGFHRVTAQAFEQGFTATPSSSYANRLGSRQLVDSVGRSVASVVA